MRGRIHNSIFIFLSLGLALILQSCSGESKGDSQPRLTSTQDNNPEDPVETKAGPWKLFRVGTGGYAANGKSVCVFQSELHLNSCGYSTAEYANSPEQASLPTDQEYVGACSCDINHPWVFKFARGNSNCKGKPVAPIFVLAGQSNAEGLGKISDLGVGEWFWNFWKSDGHAFKFARGPTFSGWMPGSELAAGVPYLTERLFGPELGLAALMQISGWKDFYFFKSAVGGTSLSGDWRSRGEGGLYDRSVAALKEAANKICDSGLQPDVRAFFWMQGESDANDGSHGVSYEQNLTRLIDQVREDVMSPAAPFILGKIQVNPSILDPQGNAQVRTAQDSVTRTRTRVSAVETNDLGRYPDACLQGGSSPFCNVHYSASGLSRLSERFYAAFEKLNGLSPAPETGSFTPSDPSLSRPVYRLRAPGEHFWSTSPTGEGASQYGYTWEGQTFHILRSPRSNLDLPIYRLSGRNMHVFTALESEKTRFLSMGFVDEGRLGYISSRKEGNFRPLHVWRLPSELRNPYFHSIYFQDNDDLSRLGYVYQGIAGYVPSTGERPAVPYKIGAYYFGMWGPQSLQVPMFSSGAANFYQGSYSPLDWWVGVRDLFEKRSFRLPQSDLAEGYRQADWSHLKPAIGFYDASQVTTLEKHIRQATQNGLSYFNFYWYWNFFTGDESLSDGLNSFLAAKNTNDMEFMLGLCLHGYTSSISPSQQNVAARLLVAKYLSRSNYLRVSNRPVIQLCSADGFLGREMTPGEDVANYINPLFPGNAANRPASTLSFINKVNSEANSAGIAPPIWTIRSDDATLLSLFNASSQPALNSSVEATQCILSFSDMTDYGVSASRTAQRNMDLAQGLGKKIMPCLSQNFDERPRMGVIKELFPAGLFRIGQTAYLINESLPGGPAYCSFSSATHMNSCGFSSEELLHSPLRTAPPAGTDYGVCGCNASNRWHVPVSFTKIPNYSEADFSRSLVNIKDWMDARVATDPYAAFLTIYAWNEWHEGGIIEPSTRDGARLLNLINDTFQLRQGSDPCRTTGRCGE